MTQLRFLIPSLFGLALLAVAAWKLSWNPAPFRPAEIPETDSERAAPSPAAPPAPAEPAPSCLERVDELPPASADSALEPVERPLARTPHPTDEQCLQALARSPLEADRVRAAMLLGRRAEREGLAEAAVPALITALSTDEAPQVWLVSARALGSFGPAAADAVTHLMEWRDHPTMRDVVIGALGEIGTAAEPAIRWIARVARDPSQRSVSRRRATEALVAIGGKDHPEVLAVLDVLATDPDERLRLTSERLGASPADARSEPEVDRTSGDSTGEDSGFSARICPPGTSYQCPFT